jgi:hypothetical protein
MFEEKRERGLRPLVQRLGATGCQDEGLKTDGRNVVLLVLLPQSSDEVTRSFSRLQSPSLN